MVLILGEIPYYTLKILWHRQVPIKEICLLLSWCLQAFDIQCTKKKTYKGYLTPRGMRRIGDDWHLVSEENAKLIIPLNRSSTCEITKAMVPDFEDKLSKPEQIYDPYNHPLLRLNRNQMVCFGKQVNSLRCEYYATSWSITRKNLTTLGNCVAASNCVH